jgi:hypothetical protein
MDQGYEDRVVAFVDILGWSEACRKSAIPGKKDLIEKLKKAASDIKDYAKKFSPETKSVMSQAPGISDYSKSIHSSIEFSFFSDCFAVSAPSGNGKYIFDIVRWASDFLLNQGFLARGTITLGLLHHFDNIIFGPALVDAVKCEKSAKFPRILCMPSVIDFLEKGG